MKKFNIGDIVTFQQYINNHFGGGVYQDKFYTESKTNGNIPKHLIRHGTLNFKTGKGEVIDYHNKYVIVKFFTSEKQFVQLGFNEKNLILVKANTPVFKFIM